MIYVVESRGEKKKELRTGNLGRAVDIYTFLP